MSFIGSTAVGRHIYSTASANGKRVQALTEAKKHALVLTDAPIRATAQRIINSAFGCAGECCMALPSIAVEESIADQLVATITELADELRIGPANDESSNTGPLVNAEHLAFVNDWIDKSVEEGAVPVLDGQSPDVEGHEGGFFLGPTVFGHFTPKRSCGNEEAFDLVL